jgi:hypothetical protein
MNESLVSEKREFIKKRLADKTNRSLVEITLDGIGKSIRRITRSEISMPYWGSGLVVALIIILIGVLISAILNEIHDSTLSKVILMVVWTTTIGYICIVGIYQIIRLLYETLYESVIDSMETIPDLDNLYGWLSTASRIRTQALFSIGFAAIMTACFLPIIWQLGPLYPRFGLTAVAIPVFFQGGITVYYLLPFMDLISRLGTYKFRLYSTDPSSSEVVECLSRMFNKTTLLGAEIEAVLTFGLVILGFLQQPSFWVWIGVSWFILFVNFAAYQSVLTKIITRTKRAKLNDIQAQIEKLELNENISEQRTMDAINRLMDYHDRIKNTPNSAINVRSTLNFINSLLLPVIGFFLGNIEAVMKLLV